MTTETINEIAERLHNRAETIDAMRSMLDHLETNPAIPLPSFRVDAYPADVDVSAIARAMKPATKSVNRYFFMLSRDFGRDTTLHINFSRGDVCERVVTGTEEIAEQITPAYTRDIVEWICPDSIMGTDDD